MIISVQTSTFMTSEMSPEKKKVDLDRNYSEETFYTDSSEDMRSKCRSAATLLQKKRQLRPINGSGNPYQSSTRLTLTSSSTRNVSLVAQKIMSAKLLRVKQLQNELTDAQFQLNELYTENRILRTLQKRQDTALKKYEGAHAELPQLIRSHNEEVRILKSKLKQVKSQCRELENNLKIRETELSALHEQHKHLIKLSKSKHLGEREQLQLQLEQMQDLLREQDKKVQLLTRKLMLESKNYKHQLTAEIARHKKTTRELDMAMERIAELESVVVTKEKYISVNLARTHLNPTVSAISLGPQNRFQLFQSQTQSAAARIPTQKHYSIEQSALDQREHSVQNGDCAEESEISAQTDTNRNKEQVLEAGRRRNRCEQNAPERSGGKDEVVEEDDTDDDCQQFLLSESTESQSYSSQMTASKSIENVTKDFKDICKGNETKFISLDNLKIPREADTQMPSLPETDVALQPEIKSFKKRNTLRRYSVSGDSELIVNDHITSSRRGSLNGAGDGGSANSDKSIRNPITIRNTDNTTDVRNNECVRKSQSGKPNAITSALEIPQRDVSAEEPHLNLTAINSTWNEIQNRIRDETIKAQSTIKKIDEESYLNKVGEKSGMSEMYDKNNLLAALRAIEGGADPVDLNDSKDKEFHLPICKSKKVDYGNVSQVSENPHRGISTRASSSVPSIDKSQFFWGNDNMSTNLIHSDMGVPKSKSDIMHEIFGHHK